MRDHKSLLAWQVSRHLADEAYRTSVRHWSPQAAAAIRQLQRASLSVVLNVVEGYAWRPGRKWKHHLRIAYGSSLETAEILEFLRDAGAFPEEACRECLELAGRSTRLVAGLILKD